MRSIKLSDEKKRMSLKSRQLNLRVRLENTRQELKSVSAQVAAFRKPRKNPNG